MPETEDYVRQLISLRREIDELRKEVATLRKEVSASKKDLSQRIFAASLDAALSR